MLNDKQHNYLTVPINSITEFIRYTEAALIGIEKGVGTMNTIRIFLLLINLNCQAII